MTDKPTPDARKVRAARDSESPPTMRSIAGAAVTSPENESFEQPVYYQPQPLVAVSDHKTLEIDTIKLAQDIDPRKLQTELRLRPVSVLPPDSGWPPSDVVVVSSQPPLAERRRGRAAVALLVLLGALCSLVLARALVQRWRGGAQPVSVGAQTALTAAPQVIARPSAAPVNRAPEEAEPVAVASAASELPPSESPPESPPGELPANVALASPAKSPAAARRANKSKPHSSTETTPNSSSRALAVPSVSKPKRAIY